MIIQAKAGLKDLKSICRRGGMVKIKKARDSTAE